MKSYRLRDINTSGLTLGLSSKGLIHDPSEEVNKIVNQLSTEAINPTVNYEVIRFRPVIYAEMNFDYYLYDSNQIHKSNYEGVIENDVNTKTFTKNKFYKSFFTLDYYTSPRKDTQTLVDRTILNTFNGLNSNGLFQSQFSLKSFVQAGYTINIPTRLFDDNAITNNKIYLKSRWFNASNGNVSLLKRNSSPVDYTSFDEEILYYEINLNPSENTYSFTNPTNATFVSQLMEFYEFNMG